MACESNLELLDAIALVNLVKRKLVFCIEDPNEYYTYKYIRKIEAELNDLVQDFAETYHITITKHTDEDKQVILEDLY